jgi:hypothetical protein
MTKKERGFKNRGSAKGKEPNLERSGRSFAEGIPALIFFGQMEKGNAA